MLFALASAPAALARSLLDDVVSGDARLAWRGTSVGLADPPGADVLLERRALRRRRPRDDRPLAAHVADLRDRRAARPRARARRRVRDARRPGRAAARRPSRALTGIHARDLRGAPRVETAVRRFVAFAGDAALVAHNARFDLAFLDREVELLTGRRIAAPVVDTVWLARRLLGERTRRVGLATLAHFFGVSTEPCHRALPDARATAEILARPHRPRPGARRALARRPRRARRSARPAPAREALARRRRADAARASTCSAARAGCRSTSGRARELRARLRSYFAGERQRPAVEAALGALERVEWRETGSELEAALEELRLLRELRPPANARGTRPDRHVYLRRRGARWGVDDRADQPSGRSRARAPPGRPRGRSMATSRTTSRPRFHRSARAFAPRARAALRGRGAPPRPARGARGHGRVALRELQRLRRLRTCVVVPAGRPGFVAGVRDRRRPGRGACASSRAEQPGSPRSRRSSQRRSARRRGTCPGRRRRAPARRVVPAPAASRVARRRPSSRTRFARAVEGIPLAA